MKVIAEAAVCSMDLNALARARSHSHSLPILEARHASELWPSIVCATLLYDKEDEVSDDTPDRRNSNGRRAQLVGREECR